MTHWIDGGPRNYARQRIPGVMFSNSDEELKEGGVHGGKGFGNGEFSCLNSAVHSKMFLHRLGCSPSVWAAYYLYIPDRVF